MYKIFSILLALLIDLTLGDPPNRFHPVVLMGNWLTKGRHIAPSRRRFWFGFGWIMAGTALFAGPWWGFKSKTNKGTIRSQKCILDSLISPLQPRIPFSTFQHLNIVVHIFITAIFLKPMFAYRNLRGNVAAVAEALATENLPKARQLAGWHLVSRDTSLLTSQEVAGAAIESLAENITDSVTAPLTAYAIGGLPAVWAYRFINTADAMWGYRTAEFEQLGKFPARLDDVLNWFPARMTAWLLVPAAWFAGENTAQAKNTMLAQHHLTSSPNAGWTMSAMAGALGVTLSKRGVYDLGGGPAELTTTTIRRAIKIADICVGLSVVIIGFGLIVTNRCCKFPRIHLSTIER